MDNNFSDFNPLLQQEMDEKEYAKVDVKGVPKGDIPEVNISAAKVDMNEIRRQEEADQAEADKGKEQPNKPGLSNLRNPEMDKMSKEDKNAAAADTVDMVLDVYDGMHKMARKALSVSDESLMQMRDADEISLLERVPMFDPNHPDGFQMVPAGHFFKMQQESIEEIMQVSPEFRNKVRPIMIRVFAKRGWGTSDESRLMYYFGKDIAVKGIFAYNLVSTNKAVVEMMKQQYTEAKAGQRPMSEVINDMEAQLSAAAEERKRMEEELERMRNERTEAAKGKGKSKDEEVMEPILDGTPRKPGADAAPRKRRRAGLKLADIEHAESVPYVEVEEDNSENAARGGKRGRPKKNT